MAASVGQCQVELLQAQTRPKSCVTAVPGIGPHAHLASSVVPAHTDHLTKPLVSTVSNTKDPSIIMDHILYMLFGLIGTAIGRVIRPRVQPCCTTFLLQYRCSCCLRNVLVCLESLNKLLCAGTWAKVSAKPLTTSELLLGRPSRCDVMLCPCQRLNFSESWMDACNAFALAGQGPC